MGAVNEHGERWVRSWYAACLALLLTIVFAVSSLTYYNILTTGEVERDIIHACAQSNDVVGCIGALN